VKIIIIFNFEKKRIVVSMSGGCDFPKKDPIRLGPESGYKVSGDIKLHECALRITRKRAF
jgi:hypothetical protein